MLADFEVLCSAVLLGCPVQWDAAGLSSAVQYNTAQYNTVQYNAVQCCVVLLPPGRGPLNTAGHMSAEHKRSPAHQDAGMSVLVCCWSA